MGNPSFLSLPKLSSTEKKEFNKYFNERSFVLFRITLIVIFITNFFYLYLDYLSAENSYMLFWVFRLIDQLFFSALLILSFNKKSKHLIISNLQFIANSVSIVLGLSILLMIYVSKTYEFAYNTYYIGLLITLSASIPLRVRLKQFIYNALLIATIYLLIALFKQNLLEPEKVKFLISNLFFLFTIIIVVLVADFLLEMYIRQNFLQTKLLKDQNEEIKQSSEEIQAQADALQKINEKISKYNKHVTDSINYAKRIQNAVLPSEKILSHFLPSHFIFYKPRNIVSGDFYFFKKINDYYIIAVADCTGHGVPGAFVSMLGIAFLNEIVRKKEVNTAAQILEDLRHQVKSSLNQNDSDEETNDGMDIALCLIDTKTNNLQFAGAYSPLFIIRNNELIQIKATKNPIGLFQFEKTFENNKLKLRRNDVLYMFSDGFTDQFNSINNKKYGIKQFKSLLLKIHKEDMKLQKEILNETFEKWKGNNRQIDDILIFGVKI